MCTETFYGTVHGAIKDESKVKLPINPSADFEKAKHDVDIMVNRVEVLVNHIKSNLETDQSPMFEETMTIADSLAADAKTISTNLRYLKEGNNKVLSELQDTLSELQDTRSDRDKLSKRLNILHVEIQKDQELTTPKYTYVGTGSCLTPVNTHYNSIDQFAQNVNIGECGSFCSEHFYDFASFVGYDEVGKWGYSCLFDGDLPVIPPSWNVGSSDALKVKYGEIIKTDHNANNGACYKKNLFYNPLTQKANSQRQTQKAQSQQPQGDSTKQPTEEQTPEPQGDSTKQLTGRYDETDPPTGRYDGTDPPTGRYDGTARPSSGNIKSADTDRPSADLSVFPFAYPSISPSVSRSADPSVSTFAYPSFSPSVSRSTDPSVFASANPSSITIRPDPTSQEDYGGTFILPDYPNPEVEFECEEIKEWIGNRSKKEKGCNICDLGAIEYCKTTCLSSCTRTATVTVTVPPTTNPITTPSTYPTIYPSADLTANPSTNPTVNQSTEPSTGSSNLPTQSPTMISNSKSNSTNDPTSPKDCSDSFKLLKKNQDDLFICKQIVYDIYRNIAPMFTSQQPTQQPQQLQQTPPIGRYDETDPPTGRYDGTARPSSSNTISADTDRSSADPSVSSFAYPSVSPSISRSADPSVFASANPSSITTGLDPTSQEDYGGTFILPDYRKELECKKIKKWIVSKIKRGCKACNLGASEYCKTTCLSSCNGTVTVTVTVPPTTNPITTPSTYPTIYPSTNPTANPSTDPTTSPSTDPTTSPSTVPTASPSTDPTIYSSTDPTAKPSTDPTIYPSTDPTAKPSTDPTIYPSTNPTANLSIDPTIYPSTNPTANPSTHPTANTSTNPTANTSTNPTVNQSTEPSTGPTNLPTQSPTTPNPTINPTSPRDSVNSFKLPNKNMGDEFTCEKIKKWIKSGSTKGCKHCTEYKADVHCPKSCKNCPIKRVLAKSTTDVA